MSAEGATAEIRDGDAAAAARATYLAFIVAGFAFASWAARIPQVRDGLGLAPSELGLVLLSIAVGSLAALPSSGVVVARYGSRATVRAMAVVLAVGLGLTALGYPVGVAPVVVGLFLMGFGMGGWDVAMNVQGAFVERLLGRAIMPRFHAGWSAGTVAGALVGVAMIALGVPVTAHLLAVALVVVLVVPVGIRRFVADPDHATEDTRSSTGRTLLAWREPRTLAAGLLVLSFAFAEGVGNDWVAVALIDGYGTTAEVATLGYATFIAAMTLGRWFGPALLDRYGRVRVLVPMTVVSISGVVLFVVGQATPVAFVGAVLWGAGLSLGFPVGMSAGADEPAMAAARVSVISSLAYTAFLAGPPLIGFLGDSLSVLRALLAVPVLLGLALLLMESVREPARLRSASPAEA